MFRPADAGVPSFTVRSKPLNPYLDTASMTVKNETLDIFIQEFKTNISKPNSAGMEMKLIRQNDTIVGGSPAVKFETTMSIGPHSETNAFIYMFYILTIANGKLYSLEFDEFTLKVPETLPIANQMVDSFRFIPEPAIGYTSLTEQVQNPKTFTPEEQAAIDTKCKWLKEKGTILSPKDEEWNSNNCF